MQQIRCDYFSDNYLEGEIEEGFLKLTITNYDAEYERIKNDVFLSRESILELIEELKYKLENVTENEKSKY